MGGNRKAFGSDFEWGENEENFDPEEDSLPSDTLVIKRDVEENVSGALFILEAHITRHAAQDSGITWIKVYPSTTPEIYSHCYVDTTDPELILDAMENYIQAGRFSEVERFLDADGRAIGNPVTFRLKLDAALGGNDLAKEVADLF